MGKDRNTLHNKLYAAGIIFLGALTIPIERDATFFLIALMLGLALFFSKENYICQEEYYGTGRDASDEERRNKAKDSYLQLNKSTTGCHGTGTD